MFIALCAAGALYAQEKTLEFSGEMKTGLYYERVTYDDDLRSDRDEVAKMHNNDGDSGDNEGRFRLNLHLMNNNLNMGMKIRFQQTVWSGASPNVWDFAFAYGNFINDQLKVTIGKLGESPWSAGGPDIWQEMEGGLIGIRTEIKPNILPGLNVGFVLNGWCGPNGETVYYYNKDNLDDILRETVVGISYTHDYFHARFSWRFDGDADVYNDMQAGMDMMYRLEERILKNYIEGFSIWANGWWKGIGPDDRIRKDEFMTYRNWLYIQYAPHAFTTQLRLGLDVLHKRQVVKARANFYYNIFPWMFAGVSVKYENEMGEIRTVKDVAFLNVGVEPQIRFTLNPNAYIALVYSYDWDYVREAGNQMMKESQKFNLRTVYSF